MSQSDSRCAGVRAKEARFGVSSAVLLFQGFWRAFAHSSLDNSMPETLQSASETFEFPHRPHSDCDQINYLGDNVGFELCSTSTDDSDGAP